jgi:hypothetical protein
MAVLGGASLSACTGASTSNLSATATLHRGIRELAERAPCNELDGATGGRTGDGQACDSRGYTWRYDAAELVRGMFSNSAMATSGTPLAGVFSLGRELLAIIELLNELCRQR